MNTKIKAASIFVLIIALFITLCGCGKSTANINSSSDTADSYDYSFVSSDEKSNETTVTGSNPNTEAVADKSSYYGNNTVASRASSDFSTASDNATASQGVGNTYSSIASSSSGSVDDGDVGSIQPGTVTGDY